MTTPFDTDLQHLVRLARTPGWKEYAWGRAQELDAHDSGLWRGIAQALVDEMRKEQK